MSRATLPTHLQRGQQQQQLIRRVGKVIRSGLPALRFHHFELVPASDPEETRVLFHVFTDAKLEAQHAAALQRQELQQLTERQQQPQGRQELPPRQNQPQPREQDPGAEPLEPPIDPADQSWEELCGGSISAAGAGLDDPGGALVSAAEAVPLPPNLQEPGPDPGLLHRVNTALGAAALPAADWGTVGPGGSAEIDVTDAAPAFANSDTAQPAHAMQAPAQQPSGQPERGSYVSWTDWRRGIKRSAEQPQPEPAPNPSMSQNTKDPKRLRSLLLFGGMACVSVVNRLHVAETVRPMSSSAWGLQQTMQLALLLLLLLVFRP